MFYFIDQHRFRSYFLVYFSHQQIVNLLLFIVDFIYLFIYLFIDIYLIVYLCYWLIDVKLF
jgi:hypothetical protein